MHLSINLFLTLDGVAQGPGGPDEDRAGGFERGGWVVPYVDEAFGGIVDGWYSKVDAVLLGRATYEIFKGHWPHVEHEDAVTRALNHGPKYVLSSALTDAQADWGDTRVLRSLDDVAQLKASGEGELQVHGSTTAAAALHEAGLVDEYRLLTFPVTVGAGKRLFRPGAPLQGYAVQRSEVTPLGVQYVELAKAPHEAGSFALER